MARRGKKKKKTEYQKQRNRIKTFIRQQRKKGVNIDFDVRSYEDLIRNKISGKELQSMVESLKYIDENYLLKKARKFDLETGEILSEDFIAPINVSNDVSMVDNIIMNKFYNTVELSPKDGAKILTAWKNTIVAENGVHAFAEAVRKASEEGIVIGWWELYKVDYASTYISNVMDYIPDQGIIYKENILDRLDVLKKISDYFETHEDWELPQ